MESHSFYDLIQCKDVMIEIISYLSQSDQVHQISLINKDFYDTSIKAMKPLDLLGFWKVLINLSVNGKDVSHELVSGLLIRWITHERVFQSSNVLFSVMGCINQEVFDKSCRFYDDQSDCYLSYDELMMMVSSSINEQSNGDLFIDDYKVSRIEQDESDIDDIDDDDDERCKSKEKFYSSFVSFNIKKKEAIDVYYRENAPFRMMLVLSEMKSIKKYIDMFPKIDISDKRNDGIKLVLFYNRNSLEIIPYIMGLKQFKKMHASQFFRMTSFFVKIVLNVSGRKNTYRNLVILEKWFNVLNELMKVDEGLRGEMLNSIRRNHLFSFAQLDASAMGDSDSVSQTHINAFCSTQKIIVNFCCEALKLSDTREIYRSDILERYVFEKVNTLKGKKGGIKTSQLNNTLRHLAIEFKQDINQFSPLLQRQLKNISKEHFKMRKERMLNTE